MELKETNKGTQTGTQTETQTETNLEVKQALKKDSIDLIQKLSATKSALKVGDIDIISYGVDSEMPITTEKINKKTKNKLIKNDSKTDFKYAELLIKIKQLNNQKANMDFKDVDTGDYVIKEDIINEIYFNDKLIATEKSIGKSENIKDNKISIVDKTEVENLTDRELRVINISHFILKYMKLKIGNNKSLKFMYKKSSVGFKWVYGYIYFHNDNLVFANGIGNLDLAIKMLNENKKEIKTENKISADDLF